MINYKNYFKLKQIVTIVTDADRKDKTAQMLRNVLSVELLEEIQKYIQKIEEKERRRN